MNRLVWAGACGSLLLAGLLLGGWAWWESQPPSEAWTVDRSEEVLSGVAPGQKVKVSFSLKNVGRRPLRLLGLSAC